MLSMEEQRILQSLERLDAKLKGLRTTNILPTVLSIFSVTYPLAFCQYCSNEGCYISISFIS